MKFDIAVGNPPYQKSDNGRWKLWIEFIKYSTEYTKDGGYIAMITPSSWMGLCGDEIKLAQNMITERECLVINSDVSKNFNVGEKIGYFILKNSKPTINMCNVDGRNIRINIHSPIPLSINDEISLSIINKMTQFKPFETHKINSDAKKIKISPDDGDILIRHSSTTVGYHPKPKNFKVYNGPKVILNYSGYYYNPNKPDNHIVVTSTETAGRQSFEIRCETMKEAKKLKSILTSKLYRFFNEYPKTGGFNINVEFCPEIPIREYTNQGIYKLFNLTDEEIKIVENYK